MLRNTKRTSTKGILERERTVENSYLAETYKGKQYSVAEGAPV